MVAGTLLVQVNKIRVKKQEREKERRERLIERYTQTMKFLCQKLCFILGGIMHPWGNMGDISAGTKRNMAPSFTGSAMGCNGI